MCVLGKVAWLVPLRPGDSYNTLNPTESPCRIAQNPKELRIAGGKGAITLQLIASNASPP